MTQHLIVLPERSAAEAVAEDLRQEGFGEVRVVREALAGEDDAEDHEWAVYVREDTVDDEGSAVAEGLRERFRALAEARGGWYDSLEDGRPSGA